MLRIVLILAATFLVSFAGTWIGLELRDRLLPRRRWREERDLLSW